MKLEVVLKAKLKKINVFSLIFNGSLTVLKQCSIGAPCWRIQSTHADCTQKQIREKENKMICKSCSNYMFLNPLQRHTHCRVTLVSFVVFRKQSYFMDATRSRKTGAGSWWHHLFFEQHSFNVWEANAYFLKAIECISFNMKYTV